MPQGTPGSPSGPMNAGCCPVSRGDLEAKLNRSGLVRTGLAETTYGLRPEQDLLPARLHRLESKGSRRLPSDALRIDELPDASLVSCDRPWLVFVGTRQRHT